MKKIIVLISILAFSAVGVAGKHHEHHHSHKHSKSPAKSLTYCQGRGGCSCDCSWASKSSCGRDDGSCCYACCCNAPTPPPPSPPSPPGPSGSYCPKSSDLTTAYGNPQIYDRGWTVRGGGAVATKASFNLLGGSVEYDVDFSQTRPGVNANIYTISPANFGSSFSQSRYCDGAKTGSDWCVEVDWIETNGNCGG